MRKQENEEEEDAIKEGDGAVARGEKKKLYYLVIPREGAINIHCVISDWLTILQSDAHFRQASDNIT